MGINFIDWLKKYITRSLLVAKAFQFVSYDAPGATAGMTPINLANEQTRRGKRQWEVDHFVTQFLLY